MVQVHHSVVKVDDTIVGLQAADNAHIPGIGVLSGNITDRAVYKQNLDRKHLVLNSLVQVVNLIEANYLNDVIIKQSI